MPRWGTPLPSGCAPLHVLLPPDPRPLRTGWKFSEMEIGLVGRWPSQACDTAGPSPSLPLLLPQGVWSLLGRVR